MDSASARILLLGEDPASSRNGALAAIGLFVLVLADATVGPNLTGSLVGDVGYALAALAVLAVAAFTYDNKGIVVGVLLPTAPTYAMFIELLHLGNVAPTPYPKAAVGAVPWALAFGVPLGLIGAIAGLAARKLAT
jgi:hypothetical protein